MLVPWIISTLSFMNLNFFNYYVCQYCRTVLGIIWCKYILIVEPKNFPSSTWSIWRYRYFVCVTFLILGQYFGRSISKLPSLTSTCPSRPPFFIYPPSLTTFTHRPAWRSKIARYRIAIDFEQNTIMSIVVRHGCARPERRRAIGPRPAK